MHRVWTPYFDPPSPRDISEYSESALKVIKYIQLQEYFRSGTSYSLSKKNYSSLPELDQDRDTAFPPQQERHSFETSSPQVLEEVPEYHSPRAQSTNLLSRLQEDISPSPQCEFFYHQVNPRIENHETDENYFMNSRTQEVANSINESIDIFNETSDYYTKKRSPIDFFERINPISKCKVVKKKKKSTQSKKITSYFPALKISQRSSSNTNHSNAEKRENCSNLVIPSYSTNFDVIEEQVEVENQFVSGTFSNSKPASLPSQNLSLATILDDLKTSQLPPQNIEMRGSKFILPKPPEENRKSLRNLRPPNGREVDSDELGGILSCTFELNETNLDEHDASMIEACSYDLNSTSLQFKEKNSQIEIETSSPSEIVDISIENHVEMLRKLTNASIAEVGMTLCYREGISLLNKSTLTDCTPNGLLLCSKFMDGRHQMIFFSSDCFKEISLRNFLLHILQSLTRKVCYDAQALILYVLDNIKVDDLRVCYEWCILDPLLGAWLLDPDQPPKSFNDFEKIFPDTKFQLKEQTDWKTSCCQLLLHQSQIMEKLYYKLLSENLWSLFLYLETQIIPILAVMESSEIAVNIEKLKEMSNILQTKLEEIIAEAEKLVGHKFSLNSTSQVRKVLYEELELDRQIGEAIRGTSVRGEKSTSQQMLKLLVTVHPLPGLLLEYRQLFKLKTAYTDALLGYAGKKGRLTAIWELCSAATGRITSSCPNLQAVPKLGIRLHSPTSSQEIEINLRSCFLARENHVLISLDFQQIELRVFAILAQDQDLLSLFKKHNDIFRSMTQLRLNKNEIVEEERNQTKTLVYALIYGAGVKKIAAILTLSESEAQYIRDTFLNLFPALTNFSRRILAEVRKTKVLKSLSGRKRNFPKILSTNLQERTYSERQAINFVIQGSAADICKGAMLRSELELKKRGLRTKLLLQIHDELLWEVSEEDVYIFKDTIEETMDANRRYWAKRVRMEVPLPVLIKVGKNWGNMK